MIYNGEQAFLDILIFTKPKMVYFSKNAEIWKTKTFKCFKKELVFVCKKRLEPFLKLLKNYFHGDPPPK